MISLRAKDYHININYKLDNIKEKWIGIRALSFQKFHIGNNLKTNKRQTEASTGMTNVWLIHTKLQRIAGKVGKLSEKSISM